MALFDTATSQKNKSSAAAKQPEGGSVLAARVLLRPRITEKSYALNAKHQYAFEVSKDATKPVVRQAVEEAFGVSVVGVRIVRTVGKQRVFGGKRGKKKSLKKAIVRLAAGQSIELFKAGL